MKNFLFILFMSLYTLGAFAQSGQQNASRAAQEEDVAKLNQQVITLFQQKKYAEALPIAKKVVEIRERESGKDNLLTAAAYRNLAYIERMLGKQKDSIVNFENSLNIYEKNQPQSVSEKKIYIDLLRIVADNQALTNRFDEAEKNLQKAVEISENSEGKDSVAAADASVHLADFYQSIGENEKASTLYLRALDIEVKKSGVASEETLELFENASCVLTKLGRQTESDNLRNKLYPSETVGNKRVIKAGVINGMATRLIAPNYPDAAKSKHLSGKVSVKVIINESGKVIQACAISGAKELQRASELAAYQSTFSPTTLNKEPVKVNGVIIYNFVTN